MLQVLLDLLEVFDLPDLAPQLLVLGLDVDLVFFVNRETTLEFVLLDLQLHVLLSQFPSGLLELLLEFLGLLVCFYELDLFAVDLVLELVVLVLVVVPDLFVLSSFLVDGQDLSLGLLQEGVLLDEFVLLVGYFLLVVVDLLLVHVHLAGHLALLLLVVLQLAHQVGRLLLQVGYLLLAVFVESAQGLLLPLVLLVEQRELSATIVGLLHLSHQHHDVFLLLLPFCLQSLHTGTLLPGRQTAPRLLQVFLQTDDLLVLEI